MSDSPTPQDATGEATRRYQYAITIEGPEDAARDIIDALHGFLRKAARRHPGVRISYMVEDFTDV